jgi:hypothetical protein
MTELDPQGYDDWKSDDAQDETIVGIDLDERERAVIDFFGKALCVLVAYQAKQRSVVEIRMSTRAMQMALGTIGGGYGTIGPAELARDAGCSKQTVDECLNQFMQRLGLSELPGQRKRTARWNMKRARESQLKQK